jgi:hypothetical protein
METSKDSLFPGSFFLSIWKAHKMPMHWHTVLRLRGAFLTHTMWTHWTTRPRSLIKKAPCGIRTHDLPLTERVLYQLS